ncbi:hypothetical protein JCM11251_002502 [Rhodosporidiobolus azoricus]
MENCVVCGDSLNGDPHFVQHHLNSCLDKQAPSRSTTAGAPALGAAVLHDPTCTAPLSPSSAQCNSDAALARSLAQSLEQASCPSSATALQRVRDEETLARRDRELALALARAQEVEAGSARMAAGAMTEEEEGETCPCCEARWADMGLSISDESSSSTFPATTSPGASPYSTSPLSAPGLTDGRSALDPRLKIEEKRRKHVEKCLEGRTKAFSEAGEVEMIGEMAGHGAYEEDSVGRKVDWGGKNGKDAVVGTAGLIPLLHRSLLSSSSSSHGRTREAYLASAETEHVSTRLRDWGWGCGYKNTQMLFSSLRHLPCYAPLFSAPLASSSAGSSGNQTKPSVGSPEAGEVLGLKAIPSIRDWQEIIEEAWRAGHDPLGRAHFNGHLVGSRRWIGTTEVYTALTWMGVRAKIIDFPKVPSGEGTHQSLVRWITNYFSAPSTPSPPLTASPHPSTAPSVPHNAFSLLTSSGGSPIRLTSKQPLYLQHRGHSRTVVGVEIGKSEGAGEKKGKGRKVIGKVAGKVAGEKGGEGKKEDEMWLLIFDPGKPIPQDVKHAASALPARSSPTVPSASTFSSSTSTSGFPPLKKLKSCSPQPSSARGGFGSTKDSTSEPDLPKYGDVLKVFRVNMNQLKRKEEYQILYVEPGPPLTPFEKAQRREVKSRVAPQKGTFGDTGGGRPKVA